MPDTAQDARPVVLVTGAAGGLGQGLVAAFAAADWQVVAACHRDPFPLDRDRVWPVQLDVTDAATARQVVRRTVERWGRLDALINNAGITANQPAWQIGDADWDRVLAVNLKGAFLCAQAVLPTMLRQRDGHIISLASFAARVGARGQASYAAAKAGVIGLTASLAREVGSAGVASPNQDTPCHTAGCQAPGGADRVAGCESFRRRAGWRVGGPARRGTVPRVAARGVACRATDRAGRGVAAQFLLQRLSRPGG
jgi:3-oxoacyl-[acyl-carrier protein] reductase